MEITDPKKAVGLWSYRVVRETAMMPVGNTAQALGRFLNGDIVRWEHRAKMAEALVGKGVGLAGGKSPARAMEECLAEADADKNKLSVAEWREKYAWLLAWSRYTCRLGAPNVVAAEKDVQMFFGLASAGVSCHEGTLHGGRVFFLRKKKSKSEVEERNLSTCASLTSGETPLPRSAGQPERARCHHSSDFATQSDLRSVDKFHYFVAVVLKPGGTKWWWELERVNVTWTANTYDRLIIDPRGKLEWSPMAAEVLTEKVVEKDVCLFQLEDDELFRAITDDELNPSEKYAHLCYAFDFFCRHPNGQEVNPHSSTSTSNFDFYMRWSAFFNPKRAKFDATSRQEPRLIEVMGERKKGWITRQIEVREEGEGKREEVGVVSVRRGNKTMNVFSKEEAGKVRVIDARLGLGDTPLDKYVQGVARWVVENNGCAVLPAGASRELRLALSHALFFVTFPNRKPDEPGGILRGYQLPGRMVEHAAGKVRGDNGKAMKERSQRHAEEATARRRKMIVDCLFARACTAVLLRNKNVLDEQSVVARMDEIGARQIIEKAAWQRGFMEGNPLNLFKPSPTAGNLKLPDLSLALAFEQKLGLKGETAGDELLVQTAPIRSLKDSQGPIRAAIAGVYPCRAVWTPSPGKEKGVVAYPADAVRILRDEGRYYLMALPKYAQYKSDRDLAFEPDVPGKKKANSVPVKAYSFKSVGSVRSRANNYVVEETFDINKVMQLARDGRLLLYAIDFGKDKWLADIVYATENKQPCKIVPTIPILAPEGIDKKDALDDGRKSGTNIETKVAVTSETAKAFITFSFNPTVARDGRKLEGRSWKGYCEAFPIEEKRHIVRLGDRSIDGLRAALQEVVETDGVLLTDKEHLDEALRAATYVVREDPYNGYNLKDRIFKDSDGRAEWREKKSKSEVEVEEKRKLNAKYEAQRKEQRGKPLCEVLSPDVAKEAEIEFTRQIEADTLVDAKTPKTFKLDAPIKVTDDFKEAVAREFRRIAYTGTMGWRQKLNRPAHEVAVGIWLACL